MSKTTRCRSAVTGKFVTKTYADKHPRTTVKETVKKSKQLTWGAYKEPPLFSSFNYSVFKVQIKALETVPINLFYIGYMFYERPKK